MHVQEYWVVKKLLVLVEQENLQDILEIRTNRGEMVATSLASQYANNLG